MAQDDPRIEALLSQLTLQEKVSMCAGEGLWHTAAVPRLGIPALKLTDGPNGARGDGRSGASAACFPVGSALGATWNPALIERVGVALGQEARSKGADVLLGPTVNLHRSPLGGRHFECYSEDPELTARIAVAFVGGVQSQGVAACIKHFVCNDSEFERMTISSEVSDRALREVYLRPFEAAVKEAGVWSIMSAYNRINGHYAGNHSALLEGVVRGEWGFDGCVISDWFAQFDEPPEAYCAMDLEMPGPARVMGQGLLSAVESGEVAEVLLDDKVRRLLRLSVRTGRMDAPGSSDERAEDRPEHRALARRVAAESMVLVKNDGVLPLGVATPLGRLAVIGPNAEVGMIQGGGSSGVKPHHQRHPLAALRQRLPDVEIVHESGGSIARYAPAIDKQQLRAPDGERPGMLLEYWNGRAMEGAAVESRVVGRCRASWFGRFSELVDPGDFCARYTGTYTPVDDGLHSLGLVSSGSARVYIDDELALDAWAVDDDAVSHFGQLLPEHRVERALAIGQPVSLRIEFRTRVGLAMPHVAFGVQPPVEGDPLERAVDAAKSADAVVLVVGSSAEYETEGRDREDLSLPGHQVELIERVLAVNPQTAVVLNCGAPVQLDWLPRAPALLLSWFPGQEFGDALCDVLLGDVNPSGRMPTTWPAQLSDTPSFATYPGSDGKVEYAEGVFVGHRGYERPGVTGIAPAIAFGHGLSYTRFEYGVLSARLGEGEGSELLDVTVDVQNVGERDGQEVVQLYVSAPGVQLERPARELRAFRKLELSAGERARVQISLGARDLAYWDEGAGAWALEPGRYRVQVGGSSADIRATTDFELDAARADAADLS